jgi:hypothetical protein
MPVVVHFLHDGHDEKFKNPQVACIYTVAEGKPFPAGIRNIIERKINELKLKSPSPTGLA